MIEGEPRRVEEVPLGRKSGHTTSSAPAIRVIAHDRMADRREMNADLVSPSGMEMGTKKIPRIEPSKAYEVGLGRPTFIDDCHALPVSGVASYRLVDSQLIRGQVTPYHNRVPPRYPPRGDRRAEKTVGTIGFGDYQETGRLLVEAMHDSGALWLLALVSEGPAATNQRVDEGPGPVAGRWMDHHSGGLVDDQQRFVLVDGLDRDIFAQDRPFFDARNFHSHALARDGFVTRPLTTAIYQHVAVGDQSCSLGSR